MSLSLAQDASAKFNMIRQGSVDDQPLQQINIDASEKDIGASLSNGLPSLNTFNVIFDQSVKGCNIELSRATNPFVSRSSPRDSTVSSSGVSGQSQSPRPTLYHSAGMWQRIQKRWCAKVDVRPLYYQHFLNIKKISDYQLDCLTSVLTKAKRSSRVEDSISLSIFLHESSGMRSALDADVELFRKWYDGEFKGTLRKKFSSERMLFKGYVDLLNDHWKPLTSEELFELPIVRMLTRTPLEIMQSSSHQEVKGINQRTYFNTLVHHVDNKDRGHTLY